jgi:hypothetical protein
VVWQIGAGVGDGPPTSVDLARLCCGVDAARNRPRAVAVVGRWQRIFTGHGLDLQGVARFDAVDLGQRWRTRPGRGSLGRFGRRRRRQVPDQHARREQGQ